MNEIWANRLIAGTQTWERVPASRKETVKAILAQRVKDGQISAEHYAAIIGEAVESDIRE